MTKTTTPALRFAILATDVLAFALREGELVVRLIHVNRPPHFVNVDGFPGGLIHPEETALQAASRHLQEKAGVAPEKVSLQQLYAFDAVDRDPRGRVISIAFLGCVAWESLSEGERANTANAAWKSVTSLRKLAYDHTSMLKKGLEHLRNLAYTPAIGTLLPKEFTLTELQEAHEIILGEPIDKRNFRKRILQLPTLKETGNIRTNRRARPAALYTFKKK